MILVNYQFVVRFESFNGLKQTSHAVYNGSCGTCMEIVKPFSAYLKLLSPAQPRIIRVIQMVFKRSLFHILIHNDHLSFLIAIHSVFGDTHGPNKVDSGEIPCNRKLSFLVCSLSQGHFG